VAVAIQFHNFVDKEVEAIAFENRSSERKTGMKGVQKWVTVSGWACKGRGLLVCLHILCHDLRHAILA